MGTTRDTGTPQVPASVMAEIIDEALAATEILPPHERLVELDKALRTELERLVLIVQQHTDTVGRGTVQWYAQQCTLDDARDVLARDLGDGLRSAAVQVHRLARTCRWLADDAEQAR